MGALDPGLKFLQSEAAESVERLSVLEGTERAGLEAEPAKPTVKVLVNFTGDIAALEAAGFEPRTIAGDVASGIVPLEKVDALASVPGMIQVELTRPMQSELDRSLGEIRADLVHAGPPGNRGSGVIVGIIDSGIDIMHGSFRRTDGSTRILSIWDQNLTPQAGESSPTGYAFGVEYSAPDIDACIAAGGPPNTVRHTDSDNISGHGTHVAGIAAGDGSAAGGSDPAFTFVGVAPEADIIVVRNDAFGGGGRGMGDSANTLDAVRYIFDRAATLNRPVVINLSQGDNVGPHDGTSLLERGIDNLLGGRGQAMVKSAGNEGARNRHATGTISAGATETVRFNAPISNQWQDVIDIWYEGADRFSISITSPDNNTSGTVAAGTTTTLTLANGNRVFVDSTLNNPNNNDNRIYLRIDRGTATFIQSGNWSLNLTGTTVVNGRFDAWIDRNIRPVPTFISHVSANGTISIPGTSQEVITAGSYVTNAAGIGSLSTFSSRGPTRDGRRTPTLCAPGEWITSARASGISNGSGNYHALPGTSMASPHVAGAVALMLERNPNLTQAEIRDCLINNARSDAFTGTVPNDDWGAGKLDAQAAFNCAAPPTLKFIDDPATLKFRDDPSTLKFRDDPATLKFRDDPVTLKFRDDPVTLKFRDDPATLKFRDDPSKSKFTDDPLTNKLADEPGTDPRIDPVKTAGLDKNPISDTTRPGPGTRPDPVRPGGSVTGAAPFVMSTPHHSTAWAESYPEAYAENVAEIEEALRDYEAYLEQAAAAADAGQLSEQEIQQVEEHYEQYQRLLQDYADLVGQQ
jgi:subtilisin family serine protease